MGIRNFFSRKIKRNCKRPFENIAYFRQSQLFAGNDGNDKNRYCKGNIKVHENRYAEHGNSNQ